MRFMMLVGASAESEAGILPDERVLGEMVKFNAEMMRAGVLRAADGLRPSSGGARVEFSSGWPSVTDGPFLETRELVAGYWIIQAASLSEAIDLMKRAPMGEGTVEIRQVAGAEDFGEEFTPELREREERQRTKMEENARRRAA